MSSGGSAPKPTSAHAFSGVAAHAAMASKRTRARRAFVQLLRHATEHGRCSRRMEARTSEAAKSLQEEHAELLRSVNELKATNEVVSRRVEHHADLVAHLRTVIKRQERELSEAGGGAYALEEEVVEVNAPPPELRWARDTRQTGSSQRPQAAADGAFCSLMCSPRKPLFYGTDSFCASAHDDALADDAPFDMPLDAENVGEPPGGDLERARRSRSRDRPRARQETPRPDGSTRRHRRGSSA